MQSIKNIKTVSWAMELYQELVFELVLVFKLTLTSEPESMIHMQVELKKFVLHHG